MGGIVIVKQNMAGKKRTNKNSLVYEKIKNMILNNQLKPGTFISENALAEKLGVSRTPVREAVVILAKEGFLEIYNGIGIYVQHITVKDLYDLHKVRLALEVCALETGMNNIPYEKWAALKKEWQSLADIWREIEPEPEKNDTPADIAAKIWQLDVKTHTFSVKSANNKFLTEIFDNVHLKVARYQHLITSMTKNDYNTILQHIEIINAIQEKDLETVSVLLKQHVFGSVKKIIEEVHADETALGDSFPLY